MDRYHSADIGVVTDCEGGAMVISSYSGAKFFDKEEKLIKSFEGSSSHFANFISAVRSRKSAELKADILEGHVSSALCHTGNISYRLGTPHSPEEIREAVRADPDLAEALGRMEQHLAANNVDLHKTPASLGALLKMDPTQERFIGSHLANRLLRREYRSPFVVPKKRTRTSKRMKATPRFFKHALSTGIRIFARASYKSTLNPIFPPTSTTNSLMPSKPNFRASFTTSDRFSNCIAWPATGVHCPSPL